MKKISFFLIIFICCQLAYSQPCLPEGITFTSQQQIDNFQTNYPNCTEIEGDVVIYGNDITNLNGLNVLTSIEGSINIGTFIPIYHWYGNPLLNDLSGLDNLTFIGGDLGIYKNGLLKNLTGLESLTSIDGNLKIGAGSTGWSSAPNDSLVNLIGLNNLISIGGDLGISNNNALTSISGLENLTSVGGDLTIGGGWISAGGNEALESLTALANLTSIGGSLEICENDSLISLAGLDNVTSIGGDFEIVDNGNLISLTGLDNVQAETINDLIIYENSSLSTCEVYSVCSYLSSPNGTIEIHDNALGCNSQQEVQEACDEVIIKEVTIFNSFTITPNPFIQTTTLEFELLKPTHIELIIYNHLGGEVYNIREQQYQGKHEINWKAENLPSGVYFCVLKTNEGIQTRKIIKL